MFLGIDIGTSAVKVVLIDREGRMCAQRSAPLGVERPQPRWSEQDPELWWEAVDLAVLAFDREQRAQIEAIGLSGQMHGATLLGKDDLPLRPAILWNDGRSFAECEAITNDVPDIAAVTGNIAMPGFTAPKLRWVRQHEPDIFDRVRTVLLPKDYVRLRMTGDKASDLSDSAGTLWLDTGARDWSDRMLGACGLSREHMPRLHEGCEVTGVLRTEVAACWGMERVPVVAGAGDNAAGAAGVGVINDGDALLSLGTSGILFVATQQFRANPARAVHSFCHCLPALWHQMSVHLSAASCVEWAARLTGAKGASGLFRMAQEAGIATGPELFLPYLSGERTPHNDPHVRGAFIGLDHESGPDRMAAAVLEGVAFALADGLAALREAGTEIEVLRVIGGGAKSRYWGTILSAALGVPLVYLEDGEVGPARGAARLAQIGATGAKPAEICRMPPIADVIEVDTALADRLAAKSSRFRAAYPALKAISRDIA